MLKVPKWNNIIGFPSNLRDEAIQVGVSRALNIQRLAADVIDSLVIKENSNISVLQKRMCREHRVVWLHNSCRDLWGWVDGEPKLGFLSIINGKPLKQQGSQTRSSTTTHSMENEKTLKPCAVVGKLSNPIQAQIHDFLANCKGFLNMNPNLGLNKMHEAIIRRFKTMMII